MEIPAPEKTEEEGCQSSAPSTKVAISFGLPHPNRRQDQQHELSFQETSFLMPGAFSNFSIMDHSVNSKLKELTPPSFLIIFFVLITDA